MGVLFEWVCSYNPSGFHLLLSDGTFGHQKLLYESGMGLVVATRECQVYRIWIVVKLSL